MDFTSSTLFVATRTGTGAPRSSRASSASPGRSPARASTASTITAASRIAQRACDWTRRARSCSSARSTPPVSTSRKRRPFHSASTSLRSRVTPASSCTTASRVPDSRFTSVDLPTFGYPTIATFGGAMQSAGAVAHFAHEADDLADDVLERPVGRVELDRVRGRAERRVLALGVLRVAQRLVLHHDAPVGAELARPPAGAFLRRGREVDLQLGARRHHRADVAPLPHPVAALQHLALLRDERRAHAGIRADPRRP